MCAVARPPSDGPCEIRNVLAHYFFRAVRSTRYYYYCCTAVSVVSGTENAADFYHISDGPSCYLTDGLSRFIRAATGCCGLEKL